MIVPFDFTNKYSTYIVLCQRCCHGNQRGATFRVFWQHFNCSYLQGFLSYISDQVVKKHLHVPKSWLARTIWACARLRARKPRPRPRTFWKKTKNGFFHKIHFRHQSAAGSRAYFSLSEMDSLELVALALRLSRKLTGLHQIERDIFSSGLEKTWDLTQS